MNTATELAGWHTVSGAGPFARLQSVTALSERSMERDLHPLLVCDLQMVDFPYLYLSAILLRYKKLRPACCWFYTDDAVWTAAQTGLFHIGRVFLSS